MRVDKIALLVTLPIAMSLTAVAGLAVAEDPAGPKAPLQPSEEAASPQDPGQALSPPAGDPASAEAAEATGEGAPVPGAEQAAEGKAEAAGSPEEAQQQEPEKEPEPVTGAFGIPLGERFEPCMVSQVLGEEERTYRAADKSERKGTRYRVEPKVPNALFASYAVETTAEGIIYSIRAEFEAEDKASRCDVTKRLAASLEDKYGTPRGKGSFGEWYAFRDMSVDHYRGIRLYANRCRRGIYSIQYNDDAARTAAPPPAPQPTEISGL